MGSDTNVAVHVNSTGKRAIDFPLDVLINIFELVYPESREPFVSVKTKHRPLFSWEEETRTCWKDEDPLSPTFFPEALAAVCPSWRAALSQISVFWTRIVIVVDDEPTPLSTVRTSLALSEPHFIDIIICRRHDHDLNSTAAERAYIDAVMALLDPHKQRWGSLHIDLRTSLESPSPITLNGDAHSLVALNIDSTEDANIQNSPGFCFHGPQLLKLHMGGLAVSRHYLVMPKRSLL
ncbi:hypothetical protein SCP_1203390 [Sparassis crispa]|uniref:Uncharacterized protein n=1 Tax=Sparassis crispa TaxID=139825 RepID=A0A401H144_9APHY|nr:hypothetical protein SCP_1203390 [Sparassis crispa]GBE88109.1 hypothetical protein SCP_1203390 [Sparassis crispa]